MKYQTVKRKVTFLARGLISAVVLKMIRPNGFDLSKTIVVMGSTRSGSTWLAEVLCSVDGHIQLFEPMYEKYVIEAKTAGIERNMFVEVDTQWPEGKAFFTKILSGKLFNTWICSQITLRQAFSSKRLVVKFVRGNMLLGWLVRNFDLPPPVLVIRHPCAIINSQLAKGWIPSKTVLLSNKLFQFFPSLQQACDGLSEPEELLALAWCIRYFAPLGLDKPYPFQLVSYEALVRNGEIEISKLFSSWDIEVTEQIKQQLFTPSKTITSDSEIAKGKDPLAGWQSKLTDTQITNVLAVLTLFGMDFYTRALEPDYEKLNSFKVNREQL